MRIIYLARGIEVRWEPEREDAETAEERLTELTNSILADTAFDASPGNHSSWRPYQLGRPDRARVERQELAVPDDILL